MRFESVSLRYGRHEPWVLERAGLVLEPGTVTAVVGGNGCGKSSLLKLAAGLVRPTSGRVLGRPRRVGYVPEQLPALRMPARAYLRHIGRVQGLRTAEADRRAAALLDRLHLRGDPHAPLGTLSKGNAQKVSLAQALLPDPQLLVLDEPWSGLDAAAHRILADCLYAVRAAGATVLLTEHRAATVAATADTVLRLHDGRLAPHRARAAADGFRLTLTAPYDAAPEAVDALRGLPGVHGTHVDGRHLRVLTSAEERDAVLLAALRRGFGVLEVRAEPVRDADDGVRGEADEGMQEAVEGARDAEEGVREGGEEGR